MSVNARNSIWWIAKFWRILCMKLFILAPKFWIQSHILHLFLKSCLVLFIISVMNKEFCFAKLRKSSSISRFFTFMSFLFILKGILNRMRFFLFHSFRVNISYGYEYFSPFFTLHTWCKACVVHILECFSRK